MKIKTQLTLGVGLLFVLITFMAVISATKFNSLKNHTDNILKANYNTLEYTWYMLKALEDTSSVSMQSFDDHLAREEKNITEIGEQESTDMLRKYFELYRTSHYDPKYLPLIRGQISRIMEMNMHAIQRKSELAKHTAYNTNFWIAGTGTLCFLIAFILLLNLPSGIANPIKQLTESIQQIETKNYAERVHLNSRSEFGELAYSFNSMAEKLEEYNNSNLAKLMIEKKRIETLINKMHDPVIGLDENLRLIFANEQALNILGLPGSNAIGLYAHDISISNDLMRNLIDELEENADHIPQMKAAPLKIFADGKESYFEKEILHISITPTGELREMLVGHVIILRNVTEYKELDSAKTNFIATVSHEFKTPISSIKMSVQLLENEQVGVINDEQKHLLSGIMEDSDRLLKITTELLNMTQVESGNIQLAIIPTYPSDILKYAANATKMQAELKNIKLDIKVPENISMVVADSEKTAWVLTNLISNAIRYSYQNSVIYLNIFEEHSKIYFEVRDSGPGIDPKYQDKIFDRYFRIPGSTKEGTGLGLAISKEFIEAQGGRLLLSSAIGTGSTFTIELNAAL